jgi:hypothetical protein
MEGKQPMTTKGMKKAAAATYVTTNDVPPETSAAIRDAATLAGTSQQLVVVDQPSYEAATEYLQNLKGATKRLIEKRKAITDPLDASRKAAMELFAPTLQRIEAAERQAKQAIGGYIEAQEAERRRQQRVADEAARKERERIEAQARETERKAREKADADRQAAEAAAAAGRADEAAALEARAATTEAKAEAKTEQLQERAATVASTVVAATVTTKGTGVSMRTVWKFEITNPAAVPREYCMPDEIKIRKIVSALQADASIAGVRIYREAVVASRGN